MIETLKYDAAVIGAGAAGLSAAAEIAKAGKSVLVIDREDHPGGILRQCIHNGFGLRYFKTELTGPEYAQKVTRMAEESGVAFAMGTAVTGAVRTPEQVFELTALSAANGVQKISVRSIVLAMGCRERNRGNLAIPGNRPAGVYTAGSAQKLLNMEGVLPGKCAVIVGSGDIGLIMARRLRWCGIAVKAVFEIMPSPSGLTRNVVQCLNDFGIPLYLEHAVINIVGRDRVEYIEAAPLENGVPVLEKKLRVNCDTVLFSVGLIPENELSRKLGVAVNPATGGAFADANCQTSVPGIFAAGNVLHVHDLVDFVSEEAARAGRAVVEYLNDNSFSCGESADAAENLKYVIPNRYAPNHDICFSFRPLISCDRAELTAERNGSVIYRKCCQYIRPAEMLIVNLSAEVLNQPGKLTFRLHALEENA